MLVKRRRLPQLPLGKVANISAHIYVARLAVQAVCCTPNLRPLIRSTLGCWSVCEVSSAEMRCQKQSVSLGGGGGGGV